MPPNHSQLAIMLLFSPVLLAAEATLTHPCAALPEPTARLACYDASFTATTSAAANPAPRRDADERAHRDFGLNPAQLRELPDRAPASAPEHIDATVAAVTTSSAGERVVTLGSGQVWVITESRSKGQVRVGDLIRIRKAALGSFKLVTEAGVALRARRLR